MNSCRSRSDGKRVQADLYLHWSQTCKKVYILGKGFKQFFCSLSQLQQFLQWHSLITILVKIFGTNSACKYQKLSWMSYVMSFYIGLLKYLYHHFKHKLKHFLKLFAIKDLTLCHNIVVLSILNSFLHRYTFTARANNLDPDQLAHPFHLIRI